MTTKTKASIKRLLCQGAAIAAVVPGSLLGGSAANYTQKALAAAQPPVYAFGDPAFEAKWNSLDGLTPEQRVQNGMVASQYFGPMYSVGVTETIEAKDYKVQYFEKERMELQPDGEVTSGLLSRDLIRAGANILVAGDPGPNPFTYKDLQKFATVFTNENRAGDKTNQQVKDEFKAGSLVKNGYDGRIGTITNSRYFKETGHNVPDIFLKPFAPTGQGSPDAVKAGDELVKVAGYPLTEAFVANITIGADTNVPVMVQAFERRVLTYNPKNDKDNQVEWGNIGAAFYDFTYKDIGKEPTATPTVVPVTPTPEAVATATPEAPQGVEKVPGKEWFGGFDMQLQLDDGRYVGWSNPEKGRQDLEKNLMLMLVAQGRYGGSVDEVENNLKQNPVVDLDIPIYDSNVPNNYRERSPSLVTSATVKWDTSKPMIFKKDAAPGNSQIRLGDSSLYVALFTDGNNQLIYDISPNRSSSELVLGSYSLQLNKMLEASAKIQEAGNYPKSTYEHTDYMSVAGPSKLGIFYDPNYPYATNPNDFVQVNADKTAYIYFILGVNH